MPSTKGSSIPFSSQKRVINAAVTTPQKTSCLVNGSSARFFTRRAMKNRAELPFTRQLVFWGVVTAAFITLFWLLKGMLLPFVLGMALAYVSDPAADRLERL